jgi:hypothetical protein
LVPTHGSQMIYAITLILLALSRVVDEPARPPCDPALVALFAPARPRLGTYEVCTTRQPLRAAVPDGFQPSAVDHLEPLEAFGTAGSYDRARMVQVYAGRRADVLRAWRVANGRVESITAISPYPDARFTALQEGTLLIRWTLLLQP